MYCRGVVIGERGVVIGEQLNLRENRSFPDNVSYMKNGHRQISYLLIYNSQRFCDEKKLSEEEALFGRLKLKGRVMKYFGLFGVICGNSFSI